MGSKQPSELRTLIAGILAVLFRLGSAILVFTLWWGYYMLIGLTSEYFFGEEFVNNGFFIFFLSIVSIVLTIVTVYSFVLLFIWLNKMRDH